MSKDFDDGGPVHPGMITSGMSLWDWYAGQALEGLCANVHGDNIIQDYAKDASTFADVMIAKKRKRERDDGRS